MDGWTRRVEASVCAVAVMGEGGRVGGGRGEGGGIGMRDAMR